MQQKASAGEVKIKDDTKGTCLLVVLMQARIQTQLCRIWNATQSQNETKGAEKTRYLGPV
jgi:hypothetical protein